MGKVEEGDAVCEEMQRTELTSSLHEPSGGVGGASGGSGSIAFQLEFVQKIYYNLLFTGWGRAKLPCICRSQIPMHFLLLLQNRYPGNRVNVIDFFLLANELYT